jgi:hypothetical protein
MYKVSVCLSASVSLCFCRPSMRISTEGRRKKLDGFFVFIRIGLLQSHFHIKLEFNFIVIQNFAMRNQIWLALICIWNSAVVCIIKCNLSLWYVISFLGTYLYFTRLKCPLIAFVTFVFVLISSKPQKNRFGDLPMLLFDIKISKSGTVICYSDI